MVQPAVRGSRILLSLLLILLAVEPLISPTRVQGAAQNDPTPNSIEFSGTAPGGKPGNSYVEVPHADALNPYGGAMTIEAWVMPFDTSGCQTLLGNDWYVSYWLGLCGGVVRFYPHGSSSAVDGSAAVQANTWTHIAVTYDGKNRRYYLNGNLDLASAENPGEITPGGKTDPLNIGADYIGGGYYFNGRMQEVRIWNTARTQVQIRDGMYQTIGTPLTGLVAEWPFGGDTKDYAGGQDGTPVDYASYSMDGALPRTLRIGQLKDKPTLDGGCDSSSEYAYANQVIVGGATAYLLHTTTDLWICFYALADPDQGVTDNWAAVYADFDYLRGNYSSSPHVYSLELHTSGTTRRSNRFSFIQGWVPSSYPTSDWDGAVSGGGENGPRQAEFRIASSFIGGWDRVIGLSLAQHGVQTTGDSIFWPARAKTNELSSWGSGILFGPKQNFSFSGQVLYQSQVGGNSIPVPGQVVQLFGTEPGGSEGLVGQAESSLDGSFTVTSSDVYTNHTLRLDTSHLPRGTTSGNATAPTGSVHGASIAFAGSPPGNYPGNIFNIHDPIPTRPQSSAGPYFLIIAKDGMVSTLQNFVDYKTRLGFEVEVVTVEWISGHMSGADIGEKVRNLEIGRLHTKGSRFRYVLLVGSNNTIPIRQFGVFANSLVECQHYGEPTDWYYADLTDNFDSNHNGCLAGAIWGDPAQRHAGFVPASGISFVPTVALGRLPFETPSLLGIYLNTAMAFEQGSPAYKSKALLAGSMIEIQGRCWYPESSTGHWDTYFGHCWGVNGAAYDTSYLMEALNNLVLLPNHFTTTRMYENEHPATGSSPAHFIAPVPVTEPNVVDALANADFGLVGLAGHGNSNIINRQIWASDPNLNGVAESPEGPKISPEDPPSYTREVDGWVPLMWQSDISPRGVNRNPGLYLTNSCSTIEFEHVDTIGAYFLTNRYAIGYVGGLGLELAAPADWVAPRLNASGGVNDFIYMVTYQAIERGQRLGDAFWNGMRNYIANGNKDSNGMVQELFGDPTLSYWGNPGEQVMNAPWAMQRSEPLGSSSADLTGPSIGSLKWTYPGSAPVASGMKPSPAVTSTDEVLVADGAYLDVLEDGAAYQRLPLDHTAYGSPAIAADGTAYVLDDTGVLYAFRYTTGLLTCFRSGCSGGGAFSAPSRNLRWKVSLGGEPLTSPVIGSDGFIFLARKDGANSKVAAVRPDGTILGQQAVSGVVTGALAVSADRKVYATTLDGNLLDIDFFSGFLHPTINLMLNSTYVGSAYSTPPTLHAGWVFAGMSNGRIMKSQSADFTGTTSVLLDSAITAGPAFDLNDNLLVGTHNGTLYSLNPDDFSTNWSLNTGGAVTGIPAVSSNGIYVVVGDMLRAFNPDTGHPLWNLALGTGTGSGSAAVGFGRELYIQLGNGQVIEVNEGWVRAPWAMSVSSAIIEETSPVIRIQWSYSPPAPAGAPEGKPQAAAEAFMPAQYLLQRSDDGGEWADVGIFDAGNDPTAILTYDDSDTLPGHAYAYRIQALDPNGQGMDSDFLMAYEQPALPNLPLAPTLEGVSAASSTSLVMKFSPGSADSVSFRIERGPGDAGPFSAVGTVNGAAMNMFTDQNLQPQTPYYYRVIAINDTGESQPSNVVSGTTRSESLPAPTHVHAAKGPDNTVIVTWDPAKAGWTAVIEANGFGVAGFSAAGTAGADAGTFSYDAGSPSSYAYRVKFVHVPDESPYTESDTRVSTGLFDTWMLQYSRIYLPLVKK